jgi:RNA polymerase sigma factor (sigma-70 family)
MMGESLYSWRLTNRSWGKGFRIAVMDWAFFLRLPAYKNVLGRDFHNIHMESYDSAAPGCGRFDLTRWSLVLEAAQSRAPGSYEALAQLCARYWQPLYGFARGRGHGPEDAQDWVQGFFTHFIKHHALHSVRRSKGRFRSFLLASFQNFMAKETRRARTEKRGGRVEIVRLDWENEEGRVAFEPREELTPETLYDAQWALLLLDRATRQLEEEQASAGKGKAFSTLKCFLGEDRSRVKVSYEEAARALEIGVPALKTLIHRLRQRHAQLVREEVERTVTDPAEVDAEVHALCEALVAAGPHSVIGCGLPTPFLIR